MIQHPIKPIYNEHSKILILGSFPSVKSREEGFFYGHPQNRFWKVVAAICKAETPVTVEEKKKFLLDNQIAVWDVIQSCDIVGSSDSSIKNVVPNDLQIILDSAPIEKIFVNGKKAEQLYKKYIQPQIGRQAICLPSTSPANAAWSLEKLIENWAKEIVSDWEGKELRFQNATKDDLDEIMKLYRNAIGSPGCTWSWDYPNEEIMQGDVKRNALFCLKNETGKIIGAISIDDDEVVENLSCWDENLKPGAELSRLVVRESEQNQGIARILLMQAMQELKNRGYKSVHFLVSKTNERALRSYAKLGFSNRGEADLFGEHWWCYEKDLSEVK